MKIYVIYVFVGILICIGVTQSTALDINESSNESHANVTAGYTPPPEMLALWEEFKREYNATYLYIEWNEYTKTPKGISNFSHVVYFNVTSNFKAKEIAQTLISDNKDLFRIKMSELIFKGVTESADDKEWDVEYIQVYNKVPVYNSSVKVSITKDGYLDTITNGFHPNISISTTPKLTTEEALEIAGEYMVIDEVTEVNATELVILPKIEGDALNYYLTYKVKFWNYTVFVDAANGAIAYRHKNIITKSADIQGNGVVLGNKLLLILIVSMTVILLLAIILIRRR